MLATAFQSEKQVQALRWLAYGARLAIGRKTKPCHNDVIWSLLVDAVDVTDRLPDQERGWLTSGTRAMKWQGDGLSQAELKQVEIARVMSGINPFAGGQTNYSPQRDDVERALGVLEWLRWLNNTRLPQRLTKAAIALARGGDTEAVRKIYAPNRKPDRRHVSEIRARTNGLITSGLKKDLRIVPGEGVSFVESYSVG
jgi:hypothetical protein